MLNVKLILNYMKINNLTKKEFAKNCGLSIVQLNHILNGKIEKCNLKDIFNIANYMRIYVFELFCNKL